MCEAAIVIASPDPTPCPLKVALEALLEEFAVNVKDVLLSIEAIVPIATPA